MYVVIVSTVSTGRVRRKSFGTWVQAQKFADQWYAKGRSYRVEIVTEPTAPEPLKVPMTPLKAA